MLDLFLIASLGFLGSFGHCLGMCGPITVALSLSQQRGEANRWRQIRFHLLLNLGRIVSYALVGAGIGALGSVLIASGQVAGVGSPLRRGVAILTGLMLIWFGLAQINPQQMPKVPLLNPMAQAGLHDRLNRAMQALSLKPGGWTPLLLGLVWGLIPCGFLYAAQLKAAETTDLWLGGSTMLAFGLGTLPMMLGIGVSTAFVGADQRGQLFRLGGWITLLIGVLTLLRTGDSMVDYSGHGAIICLMLALVARPLSRVWSGLMAYRRVLGVGAFVLAVAHTIHMLAHTWSWNLDAVFFMLPQHQWAVLAGAGALALMTPLALTSFDGAQRWLGKRWRLLHLLSIPALILAALHTLVIGSHYLGRAQMTWGNGVLTVGLGLAVGLVLLVRSRQFWSCLSLEKWYVPPTQIK